MKALLAHGANPNARMTRRPPGFSGLGGGYEDAAGATPFLLASAAADLEMMRLLLAAGRRSHAGDRHEGDAGDGRLRSQSRNRREPDHRSAGARGRAGSCSSSVPMRGEPRPTARTRCSARPIAGGTRCWQLLIDKGADVNAVSKAGITPWLAASGYGDRLGGVLYNKEGADLLLETRRRSEARKAVSGAEQVPVMRRRSALRRTLTTCACVAWIGAVLHRGVAASARRSQRRRG